MKKLLLLFSIAALFSCNPTQEKTETTTPSSQQNLIADGTIFTTTKAELQDKIKGGWAGQVIGVTYGGPTEFKFNGTMIQDYTPIPWNDERMEMYYNNWPGLYDDVYMDLTFVDVFEKEGIDAPASSHAKAFANADYVLWHANQAARYNVLQGIMPPKSGHWKNNPHADDIDFQIEADFAGLMSPGMVNVATKISDDIGHIMNYGDGWYGGVYVAAMYSLAFVSDDVYFIVKEGLKTIPPKSDFYKCIADVIKWHKMYPDDWKKTWFECEKKWSSDIGCPEGVFRPFNIDAKINAAYIIIGMLYGQGDYGKTIDISTRCGQDSDCNPASAGGILGTMMGYSNIPDFWKQGLDKVEDIDFKYTTVSLNDVYEIGMKHALQVVEKNGGTVDEDQITIQYSSPVPVRYEKAFEGLYPVKAKNYGWNGSKIHPENKTYDFEFEGTGVVITGEARLDGADEDKELEVEVYLDDELIETVKMTTNYTKRRLDIYWNYDLLKGKHHVKLVGKNVQKGYYIAVTNALAYSDEIKDYTY